MSKLRKLFIQQLTELGRPLAAVCREHDVSRQTGYKRLARYRLAPEASLADRSRRPRASPRRTEDALERQVLDVRQKIGWGARKIRAYLAARGVSLPSVATVNAILRRQGQIAAAPQPEDGDWQRFVRSQPNELWQCDHKGPLEVGQSLAENMCVTPFLQGFASLVSSTHATYGMNSAATPPECVLTNCQAISAATQAPPRLGTKSRGS